MTIGKRAESVILAIGAGLSFLVMVAAWRVEIWTLIPLRDQFSFPPLIETFVRYVWQGQGLGYSAFLGHWLIAREYPVYFAVPVLAGVVFLGGVAALLHKNLRNMVLALIGGVAGVAVGLALTEFNAPYGTSLLTALAPAALVFIFGGIIPQRFFRPSRGASVLRGTRIKRRRRINTRSAVRRAVRKHRAALAGIALSRQAEVQHIAAIGVTGSGKTSAQRALMHSTVSRGDRHVVADPDGGAMKLFFRRGDIVLNPYDARSVAWDMLAEICEESDYELLAEAMFISKAGGAQDEWVGYAREVFTACLQSWHENGLGTSRQFLDTMATAGRDKLALLCEGTEAHWYFEPGNEKMLSGLMGAMAPRLRPMRRSVQAHGELFSIRQWVREGKGTLWLPYQANQVAALKEVISCWMGLAITEVLSMPDSASRRFWFHVDELDALGPIPDLKNAQVRLRKKGGCVVMGLQSISQLRATYGAATANTIIENAGTKLILRCGASEGGGTAEFASSLIGRREIKRAETSTSESSGHHPQSSSASHERQSIETAVLASEIEQLPDLTGYLKISGKQEWMKIAFDFLDFPEVTKAYLPAETGIRRLKS